MKRRWKVKPEGGAVPSISACKAQYDPRRGECRGIADPASGKSLSACMQCANSTNASDRESR